MMNNSDIHIESDIIDSDIHVDSDNKHIYIKADGNTYTFNKPLWSYSRAAAVHQLEMHHNIYLNTLPETRRYHLSNNKNNIFNASRWEGVDNPYVIMADHTQPPACITSESPQIDKMIKSLINGEECAICFLELVIKVDDRYINIVNRDTRRYFNEKYYKNYDKNITDIKIKKTPCRIFQIFKILNAIENDLHEAHKKAIADIHNHVKTFVFYSKIKNTFSADTTDTI
jgi:hypothetical protein